MSNVTRTPEVEMSAAQRTSIDRLMARYGSLIDNADYEGWPALFTDDGVYRITTRTDFDAGRDFGIWYCSNRAMMEDRVSAIRGVNVYEPHVYRHVIGPTEIVAADASGARGETGFIVVRTDVDGAMTVFSAGRYVDEIVFEADRALLRSRVVVTDSARFDTLVALPL